MAWQAGNFTGFEDESALQYFSVAGTPTYSNSIKNGNGRASVILDADGEQIVLRAVADGTVSYPLIWQFYYRTTDRTDTADFLACIDDDSSVMWSLANTGSSGIIRLTDSASATFDTSSGISDDTWHHIAIWWDSASTLADFKIYIDGILVLDELSVDTLVATSIVLGPGLFGRTGTTRYFDDFFTGGGSGVTVSDFMDNFQVYMYAGDTGSTTAGDALDGGHAWSEAWEKLPFNDSNYAYYDLASGSKSGHYVCDGGSTWDGPNGDANIDTIKAGKWSHRMRRENGGATGHSVGWGTDGGSLQLIPVFPDLTTVFLTQFVVRLASDTDVPTSSESALCGFGHNGVGGRQMRLGEAYYHILNEIPDVEGGGRTTKNTRSHPLGQNIGMGHRMTR